MDMYNPATKKMAIYEQKTSPQSILPSNCVVIGKNKVSPIPIPMRANAARNFPARTS